VGAYQETLGDLHNLFGDTNVVSIHVNEDGSYKFLREVEGDSVEDVLSYVEYDLRAIKTRLKNIAENSIHKGYITAGERKVILKNFEEGLRGYTYFEKE
jgi:arginine decarboxylase